MTQKTIVISGGGTGIGRASALRLAQEGHHVTVVGRRQEPLDRVVAEAGAAASIRADVSTVEGVRTVVDALSDRGVSCAGVVAAAGGISSVERGDDPLAGVRDEWQASFDSNVLSAVLLVEGLRETIEQNAGRVVLLSSVAAMKGSGSGPYGAMKAALHGWVFDLARQLGVHGGTANVVAPGFVPDTGFWDGRLTDTMRASREDLALVKRGGTPDEVASLIAWLFGQDGGWMTAQVLSPNGGSVLGR